MKFAHLAPNLEKQFLSFFIFQESTQEVINVISLCKNEKKKKNQRHTHAS